MWRLLKKADRVGLQNLDRKKDSRVTVDDEGSVWIYGRDLKEAVQRGSQVLGRPLQASDLARVGLFCWFSFQMEYLKKLPFSLG